MASLLLMPSILSLLLLVSADAFCPNGKASVTGGTECHSIRFFSTKVQATGNGAGGVAGSSNRQAILEREGEHFVLDRTQGRVEFGSTTDLVTRLNGADMASVSRWLSDERRVALSIWDPDLLSDLGDSVYRLQLMTLQFVTIQLAPSVDVKMWTEGASSSSPEFNLESVSFDPNIQILPGVGLSAEDLGIEIEVMGKLRPTEDGRGVTGKIGFVSSGDLTPPMRILPEPALRAATDVINNVVADFAVQSFRKGATAKFQEFRRAELTSKAKAAAARRAAVAK